jgi:hypothetical protein
VAKTNTQQHQKNGGAAAAGVRLQKSRLRLRHILQRITAYACSALGNRLATHA